LERCIFRSNCHLKTSVKLNYYIFIALKDFEMNRINIKNSVFWLLLSILAYGCLTKNKAFTDYDSVKSITSQKAMVVSAHPLATQIGLDILKQGGNAVDASIAVQFALAVCYPNAGNIGGGGFMVFRSATGEYATLDYREKAPSKATRDMYLDKNGQAIADKSQFGHLAAGVPGTVDGMVKAFDKYSKLKDWAKLIQPSIDLANRGYAVSEREAENLNEEQSYFVKYNRFQTPFHKVKWSKGDIIKHPDLASTLIEIRDKKKEGFYTGKVAQLIVDEMKSGGGIISLEDLANYNAIWRAPLITYYKGHKIIGMPPPSSGGICLAQLLKIIEPYDIGKLGFQSADHVHLVTEAERRVYADRAQHMGDADFYPVPLKMLLDSSYIARRMIDFDKNKASISKNISHGQPQSEETTHFCVVDPDGNAVSITTTLNGGYGAFTLVKGAGFILNNEMDDFSVKPGTPNMYGLLGSEANKIEPNKRMLSSMTPTIVEKDNKLKMVVGTPGGSTIITSVFQTIVNVIEFDKSIDQAVQARRFHHQWLPDVIFYEKNALSQETQNKLIAKGHTLKERDDIGRVEAILVKNGSLQGAADTRGDDDVRGF
jgi:gamma-glutamyltranspeptidase/glutathione hydrolase